MTDRAAPAGWGVHVIHPCGASAAGTASVARGPMAKRRFAGRAIVQILQRSDCCRRKGHRGDYHSTWPTPRIGRQVLSGHSHLKRLPCYASNLER